MIIHSYENSSRGDACREYLRHSPALGYIEQLYLFPIPTTRDNCTILGTNVDIFSIIEALDASSLVVGYGLPCGFRDACGRRGCPVCDLMQDEDFLVENARLTAEAALGIILTGSGRAVRDMTFGIVGYGRIGRCMARLILSLGGKVRVYTRSRQTRLELAEYGISTSYSTEGADLSGLDILINTAPAVIFDDGEQSLVPQGVRVIDLASGDNFPHLPAAEKYPSLPARMFPVSAGVLWGRAVEKFVIESIER